MKSHEPSSEKEEQAVIDILRRQHAAAPAFLVDRIMRALPEKPNATIRDRLAELWPAEGKWFMPAMAGAVAMVLLMSFFLLPGIVGSSTGITITFELQAPDAQSVELTGSFNSWQRGQIYLEGPDATGHWTATVTLPPGQHEYLFLVDGKDWVTDPKAVAQRPDGFGHVNAILDI